MLRLLILFAEVRPAKLRRGIASHIGEFSFLFLSPLSKVSNQ